MATKNATTRLTPEQLQDVFALMKRADSVELKLSVPESAHRSTLKALRIDPLDAQIRQVFFFDTPDLALNKLRHRGQGAAGAGKAERFRRQAETDRSSAAFQGDPRFPQLWGGSRCDARRLRLFGLDEGRPRQGRRPRCGGRKDSDSQDAFARAAPVLSRRMRRRDQTWTRSAPLGPIFVLKLRMVPEELKRRFVVELWLYPDGSRILELSTKSTPAEALNTAMETRGFPDLPRNRNLGGSANQDEDRARILLEGTCPETCSREGLSSASARIAVGKMTFPRKSQPF